MPKKPPKSAPDKMLNLNVRGMAPSATVSINDYSNMLIRSGRKVFKMGLGQSPFPVPEPVVRSLQENAHQKDYLPVQGLGGLREAIAWHHRKRFGIDCSADDVLVGPGSKELMFLLQLTYYGDLVIPSPAWVSYAPQARIIGRKVQLLPTSSESHWRLTHRQLEDLGRQDPGRPRLLILNYPSNPTGTTYDRKHLSWIARMAQKHRMILLSDEIYGRLHHQGSHESIVPMYPTGTILSGGLSKWCGAGGWRLGFFIFPKPLRWLMKAMAAVGSETFTATSAPIQYASVRAFRGGVSIDRYVERCCRILRVLGQSVATMLKQRGVSLVDPEGGFYLFPDFGAWKEPLAARGIRTSVQLCRKLLEETGVAVLPGEAFGRDPGELTARLSYVNFDGEAALAALPEEGDPDLEYMRTQFGGVLEGIERICDWLNR